MRPSARHNERVPVRRARATRRSSGIAVTLSERLRAFLRSPFGKIAVAFLLFQGMHVVEHLVQVAQLRVLHLPKDQAHGVISTFDNEWIHFSWNVVVFAVLAGMAYFRSHRVLVFAALVSGVHLVEHGILLRQFLSTGVQSAGVFARGGLLFGEDGWLPRPEVHMVYNVIEFFPVLAVILIALFFPRWRAPGRAGRWLTAWVILVAYATLVSTLLPGELVRPPTRASGVRFTDVSAQALLNAGRTPAEGLLTGGGDAAAADYDRDGRIDLYLTSSVGPSRLLHNDGKGTFSDRAAAAGVANQGAQGQGACWGDYDNDGWPDLFVANHASGSNRLFRNRGDGTFTDVTRAAGLEHDDPDLRTGKGCAWGDFDRDGDLDLAVVRFMARHQRTLDELRRMTPAERAEVLRPVSLYRSDGGTFTDIVASLGDVRRYPSAVNGLGFKPLFIDHDEDGWADLYLVNDFGPENHPNVLFRNLGTPDGKGGWRFEDVSRRSGAGVAIYGMGVAAGDYDGDGHLDLYLSNINDALLLRSRGDGTYVNVASEARAGLGHEPDERPSIHWGVAFFDHDHDGWVDLVRADGPLSLRELGTGTGERARPQMSHLLRNRGDGRFSDMTAASGIKAEGRGRSVVPFDHDGDGDLDLFLLDLDETATLYQSDAAAAAAANRHWLQIALTGTRSNRDGLGARITVRAGGRTQVRESGTSFGYMSSSLLPEHFGLGSAAVAETVEIRWPSGTVQRLENVRADQMLQVVEPR